ncbi:hypothetical protein [Chryseobacterium limigenitum]|uniref:Uncharacterized protein n=1 Tax=Chryseobacterium limigenitum TaxID=1612149 RepID=A0A1K2IX70_9FLAO|nr:hypothetical protein [Chryseobacterium limigenitum]SFZ96959.1 hypothetical protein SAMN05216324_13118 [Chryseobacterium limigenitum]
MKKSIILLGALMVSSLAYSQVGINTPSPNATFDITGKPTDPNATDGLLAPRIAGNELKAKDLLYGTSQTGALVYVTAAASPTSLKTANVTEAGYYYFDGAVWVKQAVGNGNFWSLTGNTATNPAPSGTNFLGTTDAQDFQVKVGTSANNNIMRVKNSNGHVQFGNLLDTAVTPNAQNPDRLNSGTAMSDAPSNFTVANSLSNADFGLSGSQVNGSRFLNYVNGVTSPSKTFYGANFYNNFTTKFDSSIKGINNVLFLGGNQTYTVTGASTIAGTANTIQVTSGSTLNASTTAVQGGFVGVDLSISNFGTVTGNTFGLKSQLTGNGVFNSNASTISGILSFNNIIGTISAANTIGVDSRIVGGSYDAGTNTIGLRSEVSASSAANGFGLYIDDIAGTQSQHGIYQVGDDRNNFVGSTMIGAITAPTNQLHVIDAANPVRFEGLQTGAVTDEVVTTDTNGVLRKLSTSTLAAATEPWYNMVTDTGATDNTQDIYQMGKVGIGTNAPQSALTVVKTAADITPVIIQGLPSYATEADGATDAALPNGGLYKVTGSNVLYVKP